MGRKTCLVMGVLAVSFGGIMSVSASALAQSAGGCMLTGCSSGVCNPATGLCVQCVRNSDCQSASHGVCFQNLCLACDATTCAETCDPASGRCIPTLPTCPGGSCGIPSPQPVPLPEYWPVSPVRPPWVQVHNLNANETAPEISTYMVDAHVTGTFARVTTQFSIVNNNARVLEGELEFPLPDGAAVSGYAIDVNGAMVDGSVVEKEKARIAFENEVKKGIDPGLVEQVKGNAYRTRIYPIPPKGARTIRVEYIAPLVVAPNGDAALALPMPQKKLDKRDITISVAAQNMPAPAVGGLGDTRFVSAEAVWRAESHETNVTPGSHVLVAMPKLPDAVTSLERNGDDLFFAVSIKAVAADSNINIVDKVRNMMNPSAIGAVKRWRIIWDASGSRTSADILQARRVIDALPENSFIELHVFRNKLEPPQTFSSRSQLTAALDSLAYDGGTDFEPLKSLAGKSFDGMTLFFTDGMDTMNNALPEFGTSSAAFISGAKRDAASMKHICGGRIVSLDTVSGSEALAQALTAAPAAAAVSGTGISDVQGIGESSNGRITVLGRVAAAGSHANIVLSDGRQIPITFQNVNITAGKTIAAAWAAYRINALSPRAEEYREELIALGRRFGLVSPVTSLIVFESLSQWIEYDIEPPESLAAMHAEWLRTRKTEGQKSEELRRKTEDWEQSLAKYWGIRVAWRNNPKPTKRIGGKLGFGDRSSAGAVAENDGGVLAAARVASAEDSAAVSERRIQAAARGAAPSQAEPRAEAKVNSASDSAEGTGAAYAANVAVSVKGWDPDMPYLKAIKDAALIFKAPDSLYKEYLKQRANYVASPSFYLDCASLFFSEKKPDLALRILSNLSELSIDDVALLRVYAWRLRESGMLDAAVMVLRKIAKLRPDENMSWRDLAMTLTMRAKKNHSAVDAEEALIAFHKAAFTPSIRQDGLYTAVVALEEFNELAEWCKREKWAGKSPVIPSVDKKFLKNLDMDLRIAMMWDVDSTDIDMHVIEPSGEEVYYGNSRSMSGAMLSNDVTDGYGPEEYLLNNAPKGTYQVSTTYFASHQQRLVGPATITVTFYTNWGRPEQKEQTMTLRLDKQKDRLTVGKMDVN